MLNSNIAMKIAIFDFFDKKKFEHFDPLSALRRFMCNLLFPLPWLVSYSSIVTILLFTTYIAINSG